MSSQTILIVDDEPDIRQIVGEILEDEGYSVLEAADAPSARQQYLENRPHLVLLDIWMPGEDGLAVLKGWAETGGLDAPVVMISGHGNVENAVEAVKYGAYDFLEKPLSTAKLLLTVERALEAEELRRENRRLRGRFAPIGTLIGDGPAITELRRQIKLLGPTDSWVFLTGEPGAGKGVVARSIHNNSPRRDAPLVELSLAAIPAQSIAVHLFGSEQGGEVVAGCFEEANGGTLYLSEVLDLGLDIQAKLLSALQERRFLRVGGQTYIDLDVRVVSATSHDPEAAIAAGRFREDLYYRLNVVPIHVPSLRDHQEDVAALAEHYARLIAEREQLPARRFSEAALTMLQQYSWPGNVRELTNLIQRHLILNQGAEIGAEEVAMSLGLNRAQKQAADLDLGELWELDIRDARDRFERAYLEHHLRDLKGNVSKLAKRVGMERTHLYRKLKSLDLDPKLAK